MRHTVCVDIKKLYFLRWHYWVVFSALTLISCTFYVDIDESCIHIHEFYVHRWVVYPTLTFMPCTMCVDTHDLYILRRHSRVLRTSISWTHFYAWYLLSRDSYVSFNLYILRWHQWVVHTSMRDTSRDPYLPSACSLSLPLSLSFLFFPFLTLSLWHLFCGLLKQGCTQTSTSYIYIYIYIYFSLSPSLSVPSLCSLLKEGCIKTHNPPSLAFSLALFLHTILSKSS